jgi:hypothetical protein
MWHKFQKRTDPSPALPGKISTAEPDVLIFLCQNCFVHPTTRHPEASHASGYVFRSSFRAAEASAPLRPGIEKQPLKIGSP